MSSYFAVVIVFPLCRCACIDGDCCRFGFLNLVFCRDGGIIAEKDVKQVVLEGSTKIDVKILLTEAAVAIKEKMGLELIRVLEAPDKEAVVDKGKKEDVEYRYAPAWMLRRSTEPLIAPAEAGGDDEAAMRTCDASVLAANRQAARSAVGSFTMAERGLLAIVLMLVMRAKMQALREDGLWAAVAALDPERFPLRTYNRESSLGRRFQAKLHARRLVGAVKWYYMIGGFAIALLLFMLSFLRLLLILSLQATRREWRQQRKQRQRTARTPLQREPEPELEQEQVQVQVQRRLPTSIALCSTGDASSPRNWWISGE